MLLTSNRLQFVSNLPRTVHSVESFTELSPLEQLLNEQINKKLISYSFQWIEFSFFFPHVLKWLCFMSIAGFFSILLHLWLPWARPKSSTDTGSFHYRDSLQQKLDHCESTDTITIHCNPTFYSKKPGQTRSDHIWLNVW